MKKIIPFILAAAVSLPGHAQPDYPPPQIRFIVPFSPGGGTDVIMRLVAHHLGEAWKIAVLVENRVGAAGVIGSHYVVTQPPDGRTFLAVAGAFGARGALGELQGGLPGARLQVAEGSRRVRKSAATRRLLRVGRSGQHRAPSCGRGGAARGDQG